jgi:uncharacterized coiled-coil protein SlyX
MVQEAKTWFKENSTLFYFLIAQLIAAGALAISIITYMVNLEARVSTLETRGSPHLGTIDNRLTVLESKTTENKRSIDRIVDVMTKKLNINP